MDLSHIILAGNVTGPDTTLHPTRPHTMCQNITEEPVTAATPMFVAHGLTQGFAPAITPEATYVEYMP